MILTVPLCYKRHWDNWTWKEWRSENWIVVMWQCLFPAFKGCIVVCKSFFSRKYTLRYTEVIGHHVINLHKLVEEKKNNSMFFSCNYSIHLRLFKFFLYKKDKMDEIKFQDNSYFYAWITEDQNYITDL